jgi:hypothetical protein
LILTLGAAGFALALAAGLAVGRSWKLLAGLAILGVVAWGAWSILTVSVGDCSGASECTPELGAFLGAFVLLGWLAGLALSAAVRTLVFSSRRGSRA